MIKIEILQDFERLGLQLRGNRSNRWATQVFLSFRVPEHILLELSIIVLDTYLALKVLTHPVTDSLFTHADIRSSLKWGGRSSHNLQIDSFSH